MADYIVVAGSANNFVKEMVKNTADITIANTFGSVDDLTNAVLQTGTSFLQVVKAVIILDFGFIAALAQDRAEEFVYLQDTLRSNSLQETKLYLITKDTNLYKRLQDDVDGVPGIHYLRAEVLLVDEYAPKTLTDIFKGKKDRVGLYHPDVNKESMKVRLEEDRDAFIKDSQSVPREILEYGKDLPVSVLSQTDFADSPATEDAVRKREREAEKLERERQKGLRSTARKTKEPGVRKKEGKSTTVRRGSEVSVRPNPSTVTIAQSENRNAPDVRRMKKAFDRVGNITAPKGKLESDTGVLAFVGERKAGTSGMVANLADIYAMSGRSVLVIDLDIINRSQTLYFKKYDEEVQKHYGIGTGLIKAAQGGTIQRTAVQITSKVSILGLSRRSQVEDGWVDEIAAELPTLIEDARHLYDVVLIDVPYGYFGRYMEGLQGVDKNILVAENRWYDIENFLTHGMGTYYNGNQELMGEFFKKSTVVLNKYHRGRMDVQGNELDRTRVQEILRSTGYPYDLIGVAGEIPHYDRWENQYLTGIRYIWEDRLAMGVYKKLFGKVVW